MFIIFRLFSKCFVYTAIYEIYKLLWLEISPITANESPEKEMLHNSTRLFNLDATFAWVVNTTAPCFALENDLVHVVQGVWYFLPLAWKISKHYPATGIIYSEPLAKIKYKKPRMTWQHTLKGAMHLMHVEISVKRCGDIVWK